MPASWPCNLIHLTLEKYNYELCTWPENLKKLNLIEYNHRLPDLPTSLKCLNMTKYNQSDLRLPTQLEMLHLQKYNEAIVFSSSLIDIQLTKYNQPYVLKWPENLQTLHVPNFNHVFNQHWPRTLQYLDIRKCRQFPFVLPASLDSAVVSKEVVHNIFCENVETRLFIC